MPVSSGCKAPVGIALALFQRKGRIPTRETTETTEKKVKEGCKAVVKQKNKFVDFLNWK